MVIAHLPVGFVLASFQVSSAAFRPDKLLIADDKFSASFNTDSGSPVTLHPFKGVIVHIHVMGLRRNDTVLS